VLEYFINRQSSISVFTELLPSLNEIFIKLVEGTSVSRQFQTIQS
jgi:ABC-2 type transport system ATP-binding protein